MGHTRALFFSYRVRAQSEDGREQEFGRVRTLPGMEQGAAEREWSIDGNGNAVDGCMYARVEELRAGTLDTWVSVSALANDSCFAPWDLPACDGGI